MAGQARRLLDNFLARICEFGFLKITAPTVFNQIFELGTLGSKSQCSSTGLSWDMYVKGGDNVFNAKGRANEIGQRWCPADLLDFQLPTTSRAY